MTYNLKKRKGKKVKCNKTPYFIKNERFNMMREMSKSNANPLSVLFVRFCQNT